MNKTMTLTIFGGTGDLTYRKLMPALYNLFAAKQWDQFQVVVIGRRAYTQEAYESIIRDWVQEYARLPFRKSYFEAFCKQIFYYQMDFTKQEAYFELSSFYHEKGIKEHIFYLAVAPHFFKTIAEGLKKIVPSGHGRIVIEKPFGEDLDSAKRLNEQLESFLPPERIYHIDHYLGKEMVRNIQTLRFMNPIFSQLWNHHFIEHVQISALEEVGVETRGAYYDRSGALKDMVQNHLFQILSIVAMEPSDQQNTETMHQRQLEVLKSLRPVDQLKMQDTLVLGQYFGYQKEAAVASDSSTETFAALRLWIDNERWLGTPFYIRTGKKLNRREMEVIITFKKADPQVEPDVLIIKIQPTEGVYLQFNIKRPGNTDEVIPVTMDFCQSCQDANRMNAPEAYERLLMAVVQEDNALFSPWEQIELSWRYVEQIIQKAKLEQLTLQDYPSGSEGPQEAMALLERFGHHWYQEKAQGS